MPPFFHHREHHRLKLGPFSLNADGGIAITNSGGV